MLGEGAYRGRPCVRPAPRAAPPRPGGRIAWAPRAEPGPAPAPPARRLERRGVAAAARAGAAVGPETWPRLSVASSCFGRRSKQSATADGDSSSGGHRAAPTAVRGGRHTTVSVRAQDSPGSRTPAPKQSRRSPDARGRTPLQMHVPAGIRLPARRQNTARVVRASAARTACGAGRASCRTQPEARGACGRRTARRRRPRLLGRAGPARGLRTTETKRPCARGLMPWSGGAGAPSAPSGRERLGGATPRAGRRAQAPSHRGPASRAGGRPREGLRPLLPGPGPHGCALTQTGLSLLYCRAQFPLGWPS